MNNDETITFEDRLFINPEVSMAEQEEFMEKFRNVQAQNQGQINQDTYNLGTPVSSNLGGLTGAEGRWNTQYQRPQVNEAVENLRQVNMAQAVSTAMQNQQNAMGNRLEQAKRAYYRAQQEASARDRANANGNNNPSNPLDNPTDNVKEKNPDASGDIESPSVSNSTPGTTVINIDGVDQITSNATGKPVGLEGGQFYEQPAPFPFNLIGMTSSIRYPAGYSPDTAKVQNVRTDDGDGYSYYDKATGAYLGTWTVKDKWYFDKSQAR